jgi:hypothetical protein
MRRAVRRSCPAARRFHVHGRRRPASRGRDVVPMHALLDEPDPRAGTARVSSRFEHDRRDRRRRVQRDAADAEVVHALDVDEVAAPEQLLLDLQIRERGPEAFDGDGVVAFEHERCVARLRLSGWLMCAASSSAEVVDFGLHRGHAADVDLDLAFKTCDFLGALFERAFQLCECSRCDSAGRACRRTGHRASDPTPSAPRHGLSRFDHTRCLALAHGNGRWTRHSVQSRALSGRRYLCEQSRALVMFPTIGHDLTERRDRIRGLAERLCRIRDRVQRDTLRDQLAREIDAFYRSTGMRRHTPLPEVSSTGRETDRTNCR